MKNYGHVLVAVVTTSSTYMAKTRHLSDMPQTQTQSSQQKAGTLTSSKPARKISNHHLAIELPQEKLLWSCLTKIKFYGK